VVINKLANKEPTFLTSETGMIVFSSASEMEPVDPASSQRGSCEWDYNNDQSQPNKKKRKRKRLTEYYPQLRIIPPKRKTVTRNSTRLMGESSAVSDA